MADCDAASDEDSMADQWTRDSKMTESIGNIYGIPSDLGHVRLSAQGSYMYLETANIAINYAPF